MCLVHLKSTPWPQPRVGLYSIHILYLQSTNSMNNLNTLRRTVNSKQCLSVPQLAGRQTFPAEVRFQSHDRLRGIYGRQGGTGALFPPSVLVFPCQLPNHQRQTLFYHPWLTQRTHLSQHPRVKMKIIEQSKKQVLNYI